MSRKNIILGGILIILIILVYFYQGPLEKWQSNINKPNNFFSNINKNDVKKIEINYNEKNTVLEKTDSKWRILPNKDLYILKSDADNIDKTFKEIKNINLELVSNNKENKNNFLFSDEKWVEIKFLDENSNLLTDFSIGKSDYEGNTYLTKNNSDNTYLINYDLRSIFIKSDWYDKNIFSVNKNDISKIRFQYPDSEFIIEKNNKGDWSGIRPFIFTVNKANIEKVLDIMSSLKAEEIPEQKFAGTGLEKNQIIIEATGKDINNILMVGNKKDKMYYAKKGDSDIIYLIKETVVNELRKEINKLK